jgi:hypothetical protein
VRGILRYRIKEESLQLGVKTDQTQAPDRITEDIVIARIAVDRNYCIIIYEATVCLQVSVTRLARLNASAELVRGNVASLSGGVTSFEDRCGAEVQPEYLVPHISCS